MIAASVYLVRDGRVARVEHYADRAEALEAGGCRNRRCRRRTSRSSSTGARIEPRADRNCLARVAETAPGPAPGRPADYLTVSDPYIPFS